MQYIVGTTEVARTQESVVVLGNFDGIHRGHQKLFKVAQKEAVKRGLETVVFSFYPHPTWVIGEKKKSLIMSKEDKKQMIEHLGIDVLVEYPFTRDFASISPEQFFSHLLVEQLKARVLVVGSNYFFGRDKTGNPAFLKELGKQYDITVCVVEAVTFEGETISSTRIRQAIRDGKIAKANEMLGHPYKVQGEVMQGKKIGRTIGFPTLNLKTSDGRVYPKNGVYATKVKVYSKEYMGITNVGYNPTVNGSMKTIETYVFDFQQMIYGQEIEVSFYQFIRPEIKFDNLQALKQQITHDQTKVKLFFESEQSVIAN